MHPFGGGFQTYLIDHIELPATETSPPEVVFGRAFHSILTVITFFKLRRLANAARSSPELEWVADLADALQSGLAVFLVSGAFVGIVFQPMYWYFIALSISLHAYMWRVERQPGALKQYRDSVSAPVGA